MAAQPEAPDADELLGLSLRATRRGDSVRAMQYLRRALELAPGSAQGWVLMAGNLASTGDLKGAEEAYARALTIDPALHGVRFQLGLLQLTQGLAGPAESIWMPLEALGAEHPLFLFQRGLRHLIRNEFGSCIADLRAGISRYTESPALCRDMQKVIEQAQRALDAGAPSTHPRSSPV
jgi:tetratricopeptide (TPR) repeat protein